MLFNKSNKLASYKLIAKIGGGFINNTINKYNRDYGSQYFDTKPHISSMIYLNIRSCKGLRQVESEILSNKKLRCLINMTSVSQFSRKSSTRDYRIFEEIFYHLVNKAKRRFRTIRLLKNIPSVKIINYTSILVPLSLAPHLEIDNDIAGIKVSTLFNGQYTEKINIVKGQINDRKCIDDMFQNKGSIYVFDRGY